MILRGGLDLPLTIGEVTLPKTARLQLQKYEGPLAPLEWLSVASVPKGYSGQFFLSTLAVNNSGKGGLNFLEGCYHMYDPPDAPFPGVVISTGTEDVRQSSRINTFVFVQVQNYWCGLCAARLNNCSISFVVLVHSLQVFRLWLVRLHSPLQAFYSKSNDGLRRRCSVISIA
eukprot:SAG31_NODE_8036_length_1536_cov_1.178149_2_plen_172_part_00